MGLVFREQMRFFRFQKTADIRPFGKRKGKLFKRGAGERTGRGMNGQGILSVKIEYYRKLIVYKLVKGLKNNAHGCRLRQRIFGV
jgi:hypothetical protein